MKNYFCAFVSTLALVALTGCGGDKATLEEAKFYLAKGGSANALKAFNLVDGLLDSGDASVKLEAHRLYAGAQMARAGFDSISIISALIYREGNDTISILRNAVALSSDAQTLLNDAETKLSSLISSDASYTAASATVQGGLAFQLGLVNLFQAGRTALSGSGLDAAEGALTQGECETRLNATSENLLSMNTDLSDSETQFLNSGLDSQNSIVSLVNDFQEEVPQGSSLSSQDITDLCTYLVGQSQL